MDARRADFEGSRTYVSLAGAGRRYGTSTNQWNCFLQSPHLSAAIQRLSDSPTWPPKAKTPQELSFCGVFKFGGKGEIRTHGTPKGTLDFESSAFDHSATFPGLPTHRQ